MPETRPASPFPPLLESFPEPVFALDGQGCIAFANAAAERLAGRPQADLPGREVREFLSAESHSILLGHLHSEAPVFSAELEFVTAAGALVPVEVHGARDASGHVQFIACDTGARRRAEEALRDSEMRFRFMARNLTEMVLAYDMNRRLTFINPAAESLTGYTAEEIERAQFIDWVHPDDRARMLGYWDRLFEGKSFYEEEYRLITRDGRVKWVAASWGPILDDRGQQVGVQGREREVTGRRMAEETLRQSEQRHRVNEERYRALFEDSPFPMWEEDFSEVKQYLDNLKRTGAGNLHNYLLSHPEAAAECLRRVRVVDVNRAARDFYGARSRDELLGSLDKIFDDVAWEVFRTELAELAGSGAYQTEFQARTIGGEERTVSMIVSTAAAPEDWSRVIVSFFDITDLKHLEEQVQQSQKLESLGRLAGGIAHDFNNLLMVVLGYAELLLVEAAGNPVLTHGLQEIKSAGERGAELTAQLLAFSRKQIAKPRTLNLNSLIRESKSMLQRVIGEDIRLELVLAPDAWNIRADRGQLHQVLMNLVVNAREAMPHGGTVSIETSNIEQGPFGEQFLLVEVRDTGAGMDDSTRRHIFEPFFTTKGRGKGTGLGMATVFGIVTQSGGQILVDSAPGYGASFRLYFPRETAALVKEQPAKEAEEAELKGCVLVVEDQAEVRHVTCRLLDELGLEVLQAESGEDALAMLDQRAGRIDLLLTDVIMPGMNGRELAARFISRVPGARVIFMSGYTDRIISPDGLLDSSVAFLQKPFKSEELARMVANELSEVRR